MLGKVLAAKYRLEEYWHSFNYATEAASYATEAASYATEAASHAIEGQGDPRPISFNPVGDLLLLLMLLFSLTSIMLVDLVGLEHLTTAFGLVTMFRGGAAILGPPLGNHVFRKKTSL